MSGISSIPGSRVIRIKGVPPKATAADVVEFFHDIEISEHCVHLHFRERRGAGEVKLTPACPNAHCCSLQGCPDNAPASLCAGLGGAVK